ncbi:hypothetical protein FTO74_10690 [Granulicella sp. WH15]|uniref:hypothetical protein n=1 Tax=Granulicella sp. WH15 TaxID=2602070 RepID=UPI001366B702|nr:hypothetical protein [Granulicella sp. WH15]QHN03788.1 hypothetical protein FTO74_10690 [Granulicella sp. WH15]
MGKLRVCLLFCVAALVLSFAAGAWGQDTAAGANADIVKMLQAGLPESTVVNKIRHGAGRWDTSVDALIALKKVGATEAEMNAVMQNGPTATTSAIVIAPDPANPFAGATLAATLQSISESVADWKTQDRSDGRWAIAFGPLVDGGTVMGSDQGQVSMAIEFAPKFSANAETCRANYELELTGQLGMIVHGGDNYRFLFSFGDIKQVTVQNFPLPPDTENQDPIPIVGLKFNGIDHEALVFLFKDDATARRMADAVQRATELCKGHPMNPTEVATLAEELSRFQPGIRKTLATVSQDVGGGFRVRGSGSTSISTSRTGFLDSITNMLGAVNDGLDAQLAQQTARNAELQQRMEVQVAANENRQSQIAEQQRRAQERARAIATSPPTTHTGTSNAGSAEPAGCVYLSSSQPCVPLAQYQQMQAQKQSGAQGVCPASGFVPGVMLRTESDVAVGVPCKPGTPYGPLIATTASGGYTGVTPPDPASAGGSGSSSGSDSSATGGATDPGLSYCVQIAYKADPITGSHLILQNNCGVTAQVYFYSSPQISGATTLSPGQTDNTYAAQDKIAAAGGVSVYACPVGDTPRTGDGKLAYSGRNNPYSCSRR